jgi:quinol monooxygenase YgiN
MNSMAQHQNRLVRVAKLEIDFTQLESYKAALKEEIETSVRIEQGVIALYAVSEKDNPTHITIFEIYANEDAYKAHLETTHFKKYKSRTKDMIKSLELKESIPIALESKPKL